jgi:hypothetical protein
MNRRESLQRIALLLGGVALAPELLAQALAGPSAALQNTPADRLLILDEMAEMIIPTTDTPGAKAAKVAEFIVHAVEYCLPTDRKKRFWEDLDAAEAACKRQTGKSFTACNNTERTTFLQQLQAQKHAAGDDTKAPMFFTSLKMLVLHGYFTSEIGATQALNYDPIPGGWIPDMLLEPDTKAWTPLF